MGDSSLPRSRLSDSSFVKFVSGERKDPRDCARVVFPSEWAKLDLRSRTMFNELFCSPSVNEPDHYTVEDAPIVRKREDFLRQRVRVWINRRGYMCTAENGEHVTFTCKKKPVTPQNQLWNSSHWPVTNLQRTGLHADSRKVAIQGTIGAAWVVSSHDMETSVMIRPIGLHGMEKTLWDSLSLSNVSISSQTGVIEPEPEEVDVDDEDWEYNTRNLERRTSGRISQQLMTFYVPFGCNIDVLP